MVLAQLPLRVFVLCQNMVEKINGEAGTWEEGAKQEKESCFLTTFSVELINPFPPELIPSSQSENSLTTSRMASGNS